MPTNSDLIRSFLNIDILFDVCIYFLFKVTLRYILCFLILCCLFKLTSEPMHRINK